MTDDEARFAYLAEGNAKQARKRVAADLLIRDEAGRILFGEPRLQGELGPARRHGGKQ